MKHFTKRNQYFQANKQIFPKVRLRSEPQYLFNIIACPKVFGLWIQLILFQARFISRAPPRRSTTEIWFYKLHRVDPVERPLAYGSSQSNQVSSWFYKSRTASNQAKFVEIHSVWHGMAQRRATYKTGLAKKQLMLKKWALMTKRLGIRESVNQGVRGLRNVETVRDLATEFTESWTTRFKKSILLKSQEFRMRSCQNAQSKAKFVKNH